MKTGWLIVGAIAVAAGIWFFMREAKSRGMNSAQLLKAVTTGTIKPAPPMPMGPGGARFIADQGV